MNAVKSLKADWAIITLMIVVAVVMYGYLIPNTGNRRHTCTEPPLAQGGSSSLRRYRLSLSVLIKNGTESRKDGLTVPL
ncbi:small membrane protein YkgR [Klebsiella michiganensis]|uniref:small membrane protein YkgR n=1 Tax=Klebsiella michiganensis TaxID=1134687 RepID=UPI0024140588|nr:small membrane protein YkgR [Klebsiella michiganensis]